MLGFSRWQIFKTSAAAVLVVGTISLLLIYFIPAPPSTVTMGTAYKGTTFEYFGQRYRDIFARSHVELKLRETEGAMDNIELLKNPKLLQRLERLHRHRSGTVPTAIVLEPGDLNDRVTLDGRPLGAPGHGWAWVYNPLAVRETVRWVRNRGTVSVPVDVRAMVELATHTDHLEARARVYGERWMALWQRAYGHAIAHAQQALSGLIDRGAGYDRALINERIPTRLGDGTVDVEVEGRLLSPFTGVPVDALAIRANWLRNAELGSTAKVSGVDEAGRTLLDVGGVHLTYGDDGLHRAA